VIEPKPWWLSKTLAVNLLSMLAAILVAVLGQPWVASNPDLATYLAGALASLNVLLRLITGSPIQGSPADETRHP
jgi:hypothetical protein